MQYGSLQCDTLLSIRISTLNIHLHFYSDLCFVCDVTTTVIIRETLRFERTPPLAFRYMFLFLSCLGFQQVVYLYKEETSNEVGQNKINCMGINNTLAHAPTDKGNTLLRFYIMPFYYSMQNPVTRHVDTSAFFSWKSSDLIL